MFRYLSKTVLSMDVTFFFSDKIKFQLILMMDDSLIEREWSNTYNSLSFDRYGSGRGRLTTKFCSSIRNYTGGYIGRKQQLSGVTFN